MSKPALMVIVIYTFLNVWNDFFGPLIYIVREEQRTVAIALNYLKNTYEGSSSIPITMAASILLIIPSLVLYFVGQSSISKGVVFKGVEK
jgi:ABC-type glycerol-3-phosphate transport system permease component